MSIGRQLLQPILIVIFVISSNVIIGQNDYKPGYLITNDKDTLYGLINLKSEIYNSKTCAFKKSIDANVEIFKPFNIHAYRIENEKFYISKEIPNDTQTDSVFLEFLVEGIVNLYYLGNMQNEYYYIEKEGEFSELSNESFEKLKGSTTIYVGKTNQYKGALKYLFQDSPELIDKINSTEFAPKPLIKLTEDYHNSVCSDYKCINFKKNAETSIFIEPQLGFIFSKMRIKTSSDYLTDFAPNLGINFRFNSVKSRRFWNYILGINYSNNNFKGEFKHSIYYPNGETYYVDINYSTLRIPLIIEYSLTKGKIQPALSLGFNNVLLLNRKYSVEKVYKYSFEHRTSPISTSLRGYHYGFIGGIGVKYHLNKKSFLHLNGSFEYRISSANANEFLDYQRVSSIIVNVGYCTRIK